MNRFHGHGFFAIGLMGVLMIATQVEAALGQRSHRLRHTTLSSAACTEDGESAIRKVLNDQVTAWNRGDLAGFMAGYWNSPDLSFSSGKDKTRGWQATFDRYKLRYQSEGREMGKLSFSELQIEMLGTDSAFVRGRWQLKLGRENPGGLFTLIFKQLPDGWKIVHDHTSN